MVVAAAEKEKERGKERESGRLYRDKGGEKTGDFAANSDRRWCGR